MDTEQIIDYTDEWREENNFLGQNTDLTVLEDNQLIYYLENPMLDGWVRQCYFNIPEDFYELSENEQKDFLNKKYKQQLNLWIDDDDDFYLNIALASGLDSSDYEKVKEVIYFYPIFESALEYLSE